MLYLSSIGILGQFIPRAVEDGGQWELSIKAWKISHTELVLIQKGVLCNKLCHSVLWGWAAIAHLRGKTVYVVSSLYNMGPSLEISSTKSQVFGEEEFLLASSPLLPF